MPSITVEIVGGSEKENLQAIPLGDKRWGENGASWDTSQDVAAGSTEIAAYYSGKRYSVKTFDLEDHDAIIKITADGPGNNTVSIEQTDV